MASLSRELRFALRDRTVQIILLLAFAAAAASVITGVKAVEDQQALIDRLLLATDEERAVAVENAGDPGDMAYYAFHMTYAPPSALAFSALGTRDTLPWKHRIRMLALEGQLYESDVGNPELSLSGRLDFAFVAAVLLPLLLIFLLHDSEAGERRAARHDLLCVTATEGRSLFTHRAIARALLLMAAIVLPFVLGAWLQGAGLSGVGIILGAATLSLVFWLVVCLVMVRRIDAGPTCAIALLGLWLVLAVLLPAGGKLAAQSLVDVPQGGELLLAQREAVNDAWDLPKPATMDPFIERHPRWAPYREVSRPFEWKWYYAFQQVGDQAVERISSELREGIGERDQLMGMLAFLSPPVLTERLMTRAAETDVAAFQRDERCVRSFHASLRTYHYPMLFGEQPFSDEAKAALPVFSPCEYGVDR
ncbi:MAG: DUF3526 domain-containing protein [Pseudomonadota bacterium]